MSPATHCPNPDASCDACVEEFLDAHPELEAVKRSYHWCDCPMVGESEDGAVCVGCGETRDLWAEWHRRWGRRVAS